MMYSSDIHMEYSWLYQWLMVQSSITIGITTMYC